MKNMLRAVVVAVLFASGAQAATVDATVSGAVDFLTGVLTDTPVSERTYLFTIEATGFSPLEEGWTGASKMFVEVDGPVSISQPIEPIGERVGSNYRYSFQLVWATQGPATLTFSGHIERYKSVTEIYTNTSQQRTLGNIMNVAGGPFVRDDFGPITWSTAGASLVQATPVPIGGTLPLMLSALGLGAFVMRRRAKKPALA